jgi:transposase
MPWRETDNVKERMKFIAALESEEGPSFSELCRRFGISRQTGYEWKKRFEGVVNIRLCGVPPPTATGSPPRSGHRPDP